MRPFLSVPRFSKASARARGAFTLVELLVVIAIMALIALIGVPALSGPSGSRRFAQTVGQITGILEQARSYAVAQNTYVWVVFYPVDPSTFTPPDNSGDALYVAAFASNDGSDPFNWSGSVMVPPGTIADSNTTLSQILRIASFRQTAIRTENYFDPGTGPGQIASLPLNMPAVPTSPAAAPVFATRIGGANPFLLPASAPGNGATAQNLSVVQFTPTGAARVSGSPVDSIWIDFQYVKGKGLLDTELIAAMQISGLTGLTKVYRK